MIILKECRNKIRVSIHLKAEICLFFVDLHIATSEGQVEVQDHCCERI